MHYCEVVWVEDQSVIFGKKATEHFFRVFYKAKTVNRAKKPYSSRWFEVTF